MFRCPYNQSGHPWLTNPCHLQNCPQDSPLHHCLHRLVCLLFVCPAVMLYFCMYGTVYCYNYLFRFCKATLGLWKALYKCKVLLLLSIQSIAPTTLGNSAMSWKFLMISICRWASLNGNRRYVIPREGLDSLQNWGHRSADGGLWDASVPDLTLEGPGGQNSDS